MKAKETLLILLLIASSCAVFGQQDWSIAPMTITKTNSESNSAHVSLYIEAGVGMPFYHSADNSRAEEFSSAIGLVLGGGINLSFFDKLSGQVGLTYSRVGFSTDEERIQGNYLCIPVSIQFYPISNLFAELVADPCLNIGLSPSAAYIGNSFYDLEDHKANDFKIGFGIGYMLKAIPLGLSARYMIGTSDFAENLPWRGNQLSVCAFWRFGL